MSTGINRTDNMLQIILLCCYYNVIVIMLSLVMFLQCGDVIIKVVSACVVDSWSHLRLIHCSAEDNMAP